MRTFFMNVLKFNFFDTADACTEKNPEIIRRRYFCSKNLCVKLKHSPIVRKNGRPR